MSREKREILGNKIKETELVGDQIAKNLYKALSGTFITPFDREDIFELIHATDSVLDLIHGASKETHLYKLREIPSEFREMADVIRKASIEINTAFNGLRDVLNLSKYKDNCHRIGELEEQADDINHRYLAKLFQEEQDAIELIKKKDILRHLKKGCRPLRRRVRHSFIRNYQDRVTACRWIFHSFRHYRSCVRI